MSSWTVVTCHPEPTLRRISLQFEEVRAPSSILHPKNCKTEMFRLWLNMTSYSVIASKAKQSPYHSIIHCKKRRGEANLIQHVIASEVKELPCNPTRHCEEAWLLPTKQSLTQTVIASEAKQSHLRFLFFIIFVLLMGAVYKWALQPIRIWNILLNAPTQNH